MPVFNSLTMHKRDNTVSGHDRLAIILSVIFGIVGISLIVCVVLECLRRRRRRVSTRGLTPIGDDEIATWKGATEQYTARLGHASKDSMSSARIQYHWGSSRHSMEAAISPRSFIHNNFSTGLPRIPEPAAFALAPNARTGLTDETIPGADPFVAPMKTQPSRFQKLIPSTPKTISRMDSWTRGSWTHSQLDRWRISANSSLASSPDSTPLGRSHISSLSPMPLHGYNSDDDIDIRTELTPPPSRRHDAAGNALS